MHLHRWGSAKKVAPDGQGGRIFAKEEKAKGWRMPYGRKRPSSAPAKPAVANAAAGEAQQVAVASCEATVPVSRKHRLHTKTIVAALAVSPPCSHTISTPEEKHSAYRLDTQYINYKGYYKLQTETSVMNEILPRPHRHMGITIERTLQRCSLHMLSPWDSVHCTQNTM